MFTSIPDHLQNARILTKSTCISDRLWVTIPRSSAKPLWLMQLSSVTIAPTPASFKCLSRRLTNKSNTNGERMSPCRQPRPTRIVAVDLNGVVTVNGEALYRGQDISIWYVIRPEHP
eukprot:2132966-Rhodomonas_salina.1